MAAGYASILALSLIETTIAVLREPARYGKGGPAVAYIGLTGCENRRAVSQAPGDTPILSVSVPSAPAKRGIGLHRIPFLTSGGQEDKAATKFASNQSFERKYWFGTGRGSSAFIK
ncbi:MAG: hypothetical protein AAFW97_14260 [Pseudomonadota bacterium]